MPIALQQLTPAYVIHPGEMLKDELDDRSITQKEFAGLTGIQQSQLNEIIKGKRGINAEHALLIGKALQMDPSIWMNLQVNYDLDVARKKEKNQLRMAALDFWQAMEEWVPVKYFKKQGLLKGDPVADTQLIKTVYQVSTLDELVGQFSAPSFAYYRKSQKLSIEKVNLMGWMKLVAYKASLQQVANFDPQCQEELIQQLKKVLATNKRTVESATQLLASFGIKLVIAPNPNQCAIDGIALWSNDAPAIGLSLRHKRIDNFAFNVMHELGHVFLHLQRNHDKTFVDLEDDGYGNSIEEQEANAYAKDRLIDAEVWQLFLDTEVTDLRINRFAKQQGVHPATVLGRYCYETGNYSYRTKISKDLG